MTDHRTRAAELVRRMLDTEDDWTEMLVAAFEEVAQATFQTAINAVMAEHLNEPVTADDAAYDRAVDDCEAAVYAIATPRSLPTRVEKSVGETLARNV